MADITGQQTLQFLLSLCSKSPVLAVFRQTSIVTCSWLCESAYLITLILVRSASFYCVTVIWESRPHKKRPSTLVRCAFLPEFMNDRSMARNRSTKSIPKPESRIKDKESGIEQLSRPKRGMTCAVATRLGNNRKII